MTNPKRHAAKRWTATLLATLFAAALLTAPAAADKATYRLKVQIQFRGWLQTSLWPQAKKRGVSAATFKAAFKGIKLNWKLPDLRPPGTSQTAPVQQRQSEFRSPGRYFKQGSFNTLVKQGRARLAKWKKTLAAIEKRYGVPRGIIMAIWARESGYGRAKIPHNAIQVLATQAFMGRRQAAFTTEILAALVIHQEGHIPVGKMKSSWAGALGYPQFLPSKFLQFAVDFDGDGRRDIWNSAPDTLASIANYLAKHGWHAGRDWGFEVRAPTSVSCTLEGPDRGRKINDWAAMGIKRVSGRPFPAHEASKTGFFLLPGGRYGPVFIATPNFFVLKKYNESDVYALFIGHLADRYGRSKAFAGKWKKFKGPNRRAVQKMQQRLEKKGHDVGGADGLIGFKTRRTVGRWQEANGLRATCFPDRGMVGKVG